jgi:heme-degrading monooxygenase HmoA
MTRQVVVFRNRLQPGTSKAFGPRADAVYRIAERMPGLISSTDFVSEDGERLSVIEFESAEELAAWRYQKDHAVAQEEGRTRWFSEYRLSVCSLVRESSFSAELKPEPPSTPIDAEGGCACRAVRYRTRGIPREETLCHCVDCRRATGAPAVAWVTFTTNEVEWTGPRKQRRSSERAIRGFCPECGSQLSFELAAMRGSIDVTLATFDDPNLLWPKDHIYVRSRVEWFVPADGLPRFDADRESE